MRVDELTMLKNQADAWRRSKRHGTEPVPAKLIAGVKEGVARHGMSKVTKATGFQGGMIRKWSLTDPVPKIPHRISMPDVTPSYTKLTIGPPNPATPLPLAEIETISGSRLRIFTMTPELGSLVLLLCGTGGAS